MVSASPDKGEVFHIESGRNGFSGKVVSSPSLKGISHLSSLRNKGSTKLLMLSAEEEVLGISEYKIGKGFIFPLMVEMKGVPLAAVPAHSGKGKDDKLIVLCELESDFYLKTYEWSSDNNFQVIDEYELKDINRDPSELFVCDLNGDMQQDILILSNRDAPVILLSEKKSGWRPVAEESVVRKSFLKDIEMENISKFKDPSSK